MIFRQGIHGCNFDCRGSACLKIVIFKYIQTELFKNKGCLTGHEIQFQHTRIITITMDNLIPDLSTFLDCDSRLLFPDLEMRPTFFGTSVFNLQSDPPVLNNESGFPADDTSQRRMDQFSIKLVPTSSDVCFMSADHSSDPKLSFLESPRPAPLQSELSKVPSTNCELMQPEDMRANFDKLTPLEKAELQLKLAIEHDAPMSKIYTFTNKVRNEKNKSKRLALLKKLEANLSQEQIAKIKNKPRQ